MEELQTKINYLEELLNNEKEIISNLNDTQIDFIEQYGDNDCRINEISYLEDTFNEFADNSISVYSYDQKEFYFENQELCDSAFFELYGDFSGFDSVFDIVCKAGVCGMYQVCMEQLNENDYLQKLYDLQQQIQDLEEEIKDLESGE